MTTTETQAQPAEDTTEKPETVEERDARELAELGPELKAILDETWETHLPALRYLADR
ncbi:MAG: hypothetical protein H0V24_04900 [Chloroflexia bacterium]|nr:hypothetical protein [Chloroflexia bacterium]